MDTYQSGRIQVKCPFCGKEGIPAFYRPAHKQAHISRISNKSATTYRFVQESYDIGTNCPNCNAKQKDIQKWYNGEYKEKELSHKERLERMKKAGLPTRIES